MTNPPAGTPTIGGSVSCPLCRKTVDPYKLNGAHVCAGTPNAVEEAVDAICGLTVVPEGIKPAAMSYVTPAQFRERVTRIIAAVRTQAFAEVRRVVIEASNDAPAGTRHTTLTHILAALDALERGP